MFDEDRITLVIAIAVKKPFVLHNRTSTCIFRLPPMFLHLPPWFANAICSVFLPETLNGYGLGVH
jgi:hypothetical protein